MSGRREKTLLSSGWRSHSDDRKVLSHRMRAGEMCEKLDSERKKLCATKIRSAMIRAGCASSIAHSVFNSMANQRKSEDSRGTSSSSSLAIIFFNIFTIVWVLHVEFQIKISSEGIFACNGVEMMTIVWDFTRFSNIRSKCPNKPVAHAISAHEDKFP